MAARNLCEDFAPRNEAARLCWERGANRAAEMSAGGHAAARNFCEDFAPRNEAARLCGERGANRAAEKAAGRRWRGISVKVLRPGIEAPKKTAAESLPPLLTNLKTHYSACSSAASSFIISARDFR